METPVLPEESIVKQGPANMQRGAETVGGKMFLTNQRLIFESHSFNIQTGATVIALADVVETRPCWTKFLNLIPLFPNSLAVDTEDGKSHRFVLFGRADWKTAIDAQRGKPSA